MKVAIVHDYLNQYGGAERVLEDLHAIWPDAPVFVAIYDPRKMPGTYSGWDIRTSWLNSIPFANRNHQVLLPLYPQAFESFDLDAFDLVVSSSSGFAHGILTGPNTLHICYSHSPPRFLWSYHEYVARERLSKLARIMIAPTLARLRVWDRVSADRADTWVTTSAAVAQRLAKFYGKKSTIIPPSVDTNRFEVGHGEGKYFLMLMRLVGWKRPDIVVQACTRANVPLVVAGDGREEDYLRSIAGPKVRFVGRVDDVQMRQLYRDCKALLLPSEEDFGITPLEAMSAGRPVIAYGRGGVLDTILPGETGLFFEEQSTEAILGALDRFNRQNFDSTAIRNRALGYDSTIFRERFKEFAQQALFSSRSENTHDAIHAEPSIID